MISTPVVSVDVAIVTHNNANDIENCIAALRSDRANLNVVIVDNASSDRTLELLQHNSKVRVTANASNTGFAFAVNQAFRKGKDRDYVLLVNPDVVLQPGAIDALLEVAERSPAAGLYGGRMLDSNGVLNPVSCLSLPTLWQAIAFGSGLSMLRGVPWADPDNLGGWRRTGEREVPALSGAVLLVQSALWEVLSGFDETFVLYGEDVDLSLRARRLGARPRFTDRAIYVHRAGSSSRTRADRTILIMRGRATLYRKHLRGWSSRLAVASLLLGVALRAGLERVFRRGEPKWRVAWAKRNSWAPGWVGPGR